MKTGTFLIVLLIVIMGFSVYAYKLRTAYNVDARDKEIKNLEHNVAVLSYALSIIPIEVKSEVFFNSVKEKFPSVEDNDGIVDLIRMNKPEETEGKKEETVKEKRTIASTLNNLIK